MAWIRAGRWAAVFAVAVVSLAGSQALASGLPSGETQLGQSLIEPAYNDADGSLIFLLTPLNAPVHPNTHNTAPIYVVVYPTSAASSVGTVNCQHQPLDNCPDHGPLVAGLAVSAMSSVYGAGVWGHDHLFAAPASGGDFNIDWLPIVVLFTNPAAANTHITTLDQLRTVESGNGAIEIPVPAGTFHCGVVPAAAYNSGTPVTPV
jgi:hypothetical protein